MGIHDGHRARLRARYIEEGLAHFNEIDTLELLLFYAIPRRDTNELAHLLLQQFGSLDGVLGATTGDLCAVPGISENTAVLLHLFNDVARKCEISRQSIRIVNSSQDAGTFLLPYFYGLRDETVYLLCLDAKGKVLDCRALFKGSANGVAIAIRKIVEVALSVNATSVIMAHNHPGGLALPSTEDRAATLRIRAALQNLDIVLIDHIIVADQDFISMADSGLFQAL